MKRDLKLDPIMTCWGRQAAMPANHRPAAKWQKWRNSCWPFWHGTSVDFGIAQCMTVRTWNRDVKTCLYSTTKGYSCRTKQWTA